MERQELKDLSNKFKELKTLIYEYKDKKEEEIKELNLNHEKLKIEIETNQKKYEDLITVIAPRHINRSEKLRSLAKKYNLSVQILNKNEKILIVNNAYYMLVH